MRDTLRSKKYIQVNCDRGCGWTMFVGSLDPRLPDGPFICDMCVTSDLGALQLLGEMDRKARAAGDDLTRVGIDRGVKRRWYEFIPLIGDRLFRRRLAKGLLSPEEAN